MLVCMYVCRPEIVKCFYFCLFFNSSLKDNSLSKQRFLTILDGIFYELTFFVYHFVHFSIFSIVTWKKKRKNVSFHGVCMYIRPKLTFVCFYFCFFAPSPNCDSHFFLTGTTHLVKYRVPFLTGSAPCWVELVYSLHILLLNRSTFAFLVGILPSSTTVKNLLQQF